MIVSWAQFVFRWSLTLQGTFDLILEGLEVLVLGHLEQVRARLAGGGGGAHRVERRPIDANLLVIHSRAKFIDGGTTVDGATLIDQLYLHFVAWWW